jgi:two-component system OmpR family response regulator/two-component system alkaline phosphatase synthesis response regulator PhoP
VNDALRRILIIEDQAVIRKAIRMACEKDGYEVVEAANGSEGLRLVAQAEPDLILLDVVLPDTSGLDVCREVRKSGSGVPIIILSAKTDESDMVAGLEIGADDYITKPFRARELLARIAAHLRRGPQDANGTDGRLDFKDLAISLNDRRVSKGGEVVDLTHTEFDLLAFLASNSGKVLSRERILNHVWGYEYPIETVVTDVHIRNLRRKIETDPSRPFFILAVPGIGYRFTSLASKQ